MNYGIKISKRNVSVTTLKRSKPKPDSAYRVAHVLSMLAIPYLHGAQTQVTRYRMAAAQLQRQPIQGVLSCLHETSALFEDLSTVRYYANKIGKRNGLDQLILDVRNHIRHDVREGFDAEKDRFKDGRLHRTTRLQLNKRLLTNIGFDLESIKVGGVTIKIQEINDYINWAAKQFADSISEAQKQNLIH